MWMSLTMGNLVFTPIEIIKQFFESLIRFKTLDVRWKYIHEDRDVIKRLRESVQK